MARIHGLVFVCAGTLSAIALAPPRAFGQCSPSGLDDGPLEITKGSLDIDVHYTNDDWLDCSEAGDYFSTSQAQNALNSLGTSYDLYQAFGFLEPYFSNLPEYNIFVYDSGDIGTTGTTCITLDAPGRRCSPEKRVRKTLQHEMFHSMQLRYLCSVTDCDDLGAYASVGWWVIEGTARCLDDRLYSDLDNETYSTTFWEEVSEFMDQPDVSMLDQSYRSCLFWSYCCERLGSVSSEPQRGIDFMRRFWEQLAANGSTDSLAALDDEIRDSGGGSLDQMFHDFAICTYTREFDASALPNSSRYFFLDEQPGGGGGPAYDNVERAGTFNAFPANGAGNIAAYAAKYYELTFDANACAAVGFLGEADEPIAWALVGVTPANKATILSKGKGRDYGRTFLNSPTESINRLGAIVIGLGQASDFSFTFDVGTPRVSIIRPDTAHLAYAGTAASPGRFLVRCFVEGPEALKPPGAGPRSIKGLRQEDFAVRVDGLDADVISAAYVGGEYWLTVQAPPRPDGLYDLQVQLCQGVTGGGVQDTNAKSVLYAEIRINHMVVIDQSGSMADPADFSKLDAAKIAGSLYVDAVSDDDRIGVVAFDGNQVACDDDAILLEAMNTATAGKRDNCKNDIGNLNPGGWTSIGDGLWKAQDQLEIPAFATDADIHAIILLSDGEENEARFWNTPAGCSAPDTARARIEPTDTVVNTIAFGPESNQDLMQTIAATTGGDYSYVDVTDAGAIHAAPGDGPTTMANQLADAYMRGLQRARGLDRIFFTAGDIAANNGATIDIPVTESGVSEGTVFVNWTKGNALAGLELIKPNGNPVAAAEATFYQTPTHGVWHLKIVMPPGTWRVQFNSTADTEYIAGLLGHQRFGVHMLVHATQVNTGGLVNEPDEGPFERGVPVTILAVLTDAKGPVLKARLDLSVRRPDGSFACGPLTLRDDGTQNDGEPDDGVYGAIFTDTSQAGSRSGVINDDPQNPHPPGARGTYLVSIVGSGESQAAGKFTRYGSASFHIFAGRRDRDQDGLPDTWEVYYGTNPSKPDNAEDPDGDGLTNEEEFKHGTHPFDDDTDGGGELDGSEVKAGRCPTEPSDDLLPCPLDVAVVTTTEDISPLLLQPDALLLRFPISPSYRQMRVFRRKVGDLGPMQLIDTINLSQFKPPYYDKNLPTGVPFEYRFQAEGANGALSCLSPIVQGTAKSQPRRPRGWATLNNESSRTDRLNVVLRLDRSNHPFEGMPKEYRAANSPLTNQAYLPMPNGPIGWVLSGPAILPGLRRVYVQYRDADGNESEPTLETILYDPFGDFDSDGQANNVDPDDDDDGLPDDTELQVGTDPFDPDSDDDGLTDGKEADAGTNPRNPDTDGDGLQDGEDPYPLIAPDPPDVDGDGDVDKDDYLVFMGCATGPEVPGVTPNCTGLDFDEDDDIDQGDFGVFQRCYSGPGKPFDPGCKQ